MRSLLAFIKKEALDQLRSGRLMLLGILFVLFGIMNPADSLSFSGHPDSAKLYENYKEALENIKNICYNVT